MAVGTRDDFANFDLTANTFISEELERVAREVFTASNGAVQLLSRNTIGDFDKTSSFKLDPDLVRDRDDKSVAPTTPDKIEQRVDTRPVTKKAVKIENTEDSFTTNGYTLAQMQIIMSNQWAQVKPANMLDSGLAAGIAAMTSNPGVTHTVAGSIDHRGMNGAMRKFGDRMGSIVAWVMHSGSYFDLLDQVLGNTAFETSGIAIREGTVGTLGKPVIVVDSPSLLIPGAPADPGPATPDVLKVMGLARGGIVIAENTLDNILVERASVSDNITRKFVVNTEYAVGVRGYGWKTTAGRNPTTAQLAASANWEKVAGQNKATAGVLLTHNAA